MRRRAFLEGGAALASTLLVGLARAKPSPITTVFHHPSCAKHIAGEGHPEHSGRTDAVLKAMGVLEREGGITLAKGKIADEEEVQLVHSKSYFERVKSEIQQGAPQLSAGDVALSSGSLEAALAAVGCLISAVDAVMAGDAKNAFCAVRPPGHHASAERGMGFCLFNNVAVAARYARKKYGVQRVLIADWDVHHGNGTQDIFWRDKSVMFFDTHMDPWYPGTGGIDEIGEGEAKGQIINRPFPAGAGREEILGAYKEDLVPAAAHFKPELVLISAGFDSRAGDPLGQFQLADKDYAAMTDVLTGIARKYAGGRIVSALEGGYNLKGLASATTAHVRRLAAA
ncbi:MAG: histone deacetylase [Betaproteobacteria bacterium]|nr:histone deacetylase [Betaproteobacteria bacterium]